MSFICKVCGPVGNCQKQTKIPTKIRDVEYNLQVKTIYADGETIKTVRKSQGTELVEEGVYCIKHIPEKFKPIKEEKVTRDQLIKTIAVRKNNEKDNEIDEENTKRNIRTKDKKEQ
jgi:hypothetical protein